MPTKTNSPLHIAPALIGMGIKGLAGGLGEVLRDRKEAKDAGEKYSFKEASQLEKPPIITSHLAIKQLLCTT